MENLQRKLPNFKLNPKWCILCQKHSENMDHLFLRCNTASTIWSKVASKIGWHNSHSLIYSLCKEMLSTLIVATLWTLWNERNRRIFSNADKSNTGIWENICTLTGLWTHKAQILKITALQPLL